MFGLQPRIRSPSHVTATYTVHHTVLAERYSCNFCETQFGSHNHLKIHIQVHVGETPYFCKECPDLKFLSPKMLKQHTQKFHNLTSGVSSKRFSCRVCSKSFGAKSTFDRHMKVHSKKASFQCKLCLSVFDSMADWGLHVRTHPEFEKSQELGESAKKGFKCDHCRKIFIANKYLLQHSMTHRLELEFNCRPCSVVLKRLQ